VTVLATIHSHCNDGLNEPFGADGLGRWDNKRIDSFIVIPKNLGGRNPMKIYVLPSTAVDKTQWDVYHIFE